MPSKEDLHFVSPATAAAMGERSTTQDFLARDMDELVSEIKENLRLRSKPYHSLCKQRATPYRIPVAAAAKTRSTSTKNATAQLDSKCCHSCGSPTCLRTCDKKPRRDSSDPYEVLQMLLRKGSLIKEAVKRLQNEPCACGRSDSVGNNGCSTGGIGGGICGPAAAITEDELL